MWIGVHDEREHAPPHEDPPEGRGFRHRGTDRARQEATQTPADPNWRRVERVNDRHTQVLSAVVHSGRLQSTCGR